MLSFSGLSAVYKRARYFNLSVILFFGEISNNSLRHPVGQSLSVIAYNESALVEGILQVSQFNESGYGIGMQQHVKIACAYGSAETAIGLMSGIF